MPPPTPNANTTLTPAQRRVERSQRNLSAAVKSRARTKLHQAELMEQKSHLLEREALLREQLAATPTVGGMRPAGPSRRPSAPGMVLLSPELSAIFGGRTEVRADALADVLDRALTGSRGKPPPVDPELVALWAQAQRDAPKNNKLALREAARAAGVNVRAPQRHRPSVRGRKAARNGGKKGAAASGASERRT